MTGLQGIGETGKEGRRITCWDRILDTIESE